MFAEKAVGKDGRAAQWMRRCAASTLTQSCGVSMRSTQGAMGAGVVASDTHRDKLTCTLARNATLAKSEGGPSQAMLATLLSIGIQLADEGAGA